MNANEYISPILENIAHESYLISRSIYVNVNDFSFSTNAAILDFLQFGFSDEGQLLLTNQTGYVELINSSHLETNETLNTRGVLSPDFNYNHLGGDEVIELFETDCSSTSNTSSSLYWNLTFAVSTTVYPVVMTLLKLGAHKNGDCVSISLIGGGSSNDADKVCDGNVLVVDMRMCLNICYVCGNYYRENIIQLTSFSNPSAKLASKERKSCLKIY